MRGAEARSLSLPQAEDFEAVTGMGVQGTVEGRAVALGNAWMLEGLGLDARGARPRRTRAAPRARR